MLRCDCHRTRRFGRALWRCQGPCPKQAQQIGALPRTEIHNLLQYLGISLSVVLPFQYKASKAICSGQLIHNTSSPPEHPLLKMSCTKINSAGLPPVTLSLTALTPGRGRRYFPHQGAIRISFQPAEHQDRLQQQQKVTARDITGSKCNGRGPAQCSLATAATQLLRTASENSCQGEKTLWVIAGLSCTVT